MQDLRLSSISVRALCSTLTKQFGLQVFTRNRGLGELNVNTERSFDDVLPQYQF